MSGRYIRLGRPGASALDALLAVADRSQLTYDDVGSTMPPSAARVERLELGTGADTFRAAVDGLGSWACHRGIGATVHPADAPIRVGATLLVVLSLGPVSIVVPDRVVAVLDAPRRFGFAYGTLEGHQERGEESFVVEHLDDDRVVASVSVDATAATVGARLASRAVRLFQRVAVRRYLAALRDAVRS